MYNAHFKLRESPFENTPDPRFYFSTPAQEETLACLIHVIRHRKGAALLTGLPGCGKTFAARLALRALTAETRCVWLTGASLEPAQLLADICRGFQLDAAPDLPQSELLARLENFLVSQFRSGVVCTIIADEAQDLPPDALRLFKTLNNLEVDDAKLVQLILVGHPATQLRLAAPGCDALGQRLFRILELPPLSLEQSADYIRHRIARAGEHPDVNFTDDAIRRIHQAAGGVPRAINRLCEFALLAAYAQGTTHVDLPLVDTILDENDFDESSLAAATQPPPEAGAVPLLRREVELARRMARRLRAGRRRLDHTLAQVDQASAVLRDARHAGQQQAARLIGANDTAAHHTARLVQLGESLHAQVQRQQQADREAECRAQRQAEEFERRLTEWDRRAQQIGAAIEEAADVAARDIRARTERMVDDAARKIDLLLTEARAKADRIVVEAEQRRDRIGEEAAQTLARVENATCALQADLAGAAAQAGEYQKMAGQGRAAAEQLAALVARAQESADMYRKLEQVLRTAEDRAMQCITSADAHLCRLDEADTRLGRTEQQAQATLASMDRALAAGRRLDALLQTAERREQTLHEAQLALQQTIDSAQQQEAVLEQAVHDCRTAAESAAALHDRSETVHTQVDGLVTRSESLLAAVTERELRGRLLIQSVERNLSELRQAESASDALLQRSTAAVVELQRARGEALAASEETRTHTAAAHDVAARADQAADQLDDNLRRLDAAHAATRATLDDAGRIETAIRRHAEAYAGAAEETRKQLASLALEQQRLDERLEEAAARGVALVNDVTDRLHAAEPTLAAVEQACADSRRLIADLAAAREAAGDLHESVTRDVTQAERLVLRAEDACQRVRLAEQDAQRERERLSDLTQHAQRAVAAGEEKIAAIMARGENLLLTVAERLDELSGAAERSAAALTREREQLGESERRTTAFQRQVQAALDELRRTLERAEEVNRDAETRFAAQATETGAMEVRARELSERIRIDCFDAEQAAAKLEQAVQQTEQAVLQPRAMLDELVARVPELQQLCTMLQEIYFKLSAHVPDVITPTEWAALDRTADGRLRKGLIANAARTRQLVQAVRRLHDHTSRQISSLQEENRRAAALCRLLPQQFQAALPMLREPQRIITRLEQAIDELQGLMQSLPDASAVGTDSIAEESHPRRAQLFRIRRDLSERVSRLSGIIREASTAAADDLVELPARD